MLLLAKPVVAQMREQTKEFIQTAWLIGKKVAIFLWSNDVASGVYVKQKKKYGEDIGLQVEILHDPEISYEQANILIDSYNRDSECIGMIIQLPLASHLQAYQPELLTAVLAEKDIDGLSGVGLGYSLVWKHSFLPATPKSAVSILDFYGYGDVAGKVILVIGQSVLFGRPFTLEMMKRGATVISGNARSPTGFLKTSAQEADMIVTATGVCHLIDASWYESDWSEKILIDVGYGIKDGKAYGDIDWEFFQDKVKAITPVPWGVGPVTVAALFDNVRELRI
jgi:methylenetetrahydrofolate dehydrogenase (NADP+) / methenyltetrahydrofolate cyclohydrolase